MSAFAVSLVIEPRPPDFYGIDGPIRQMRKYDEFASGLGAALVVPVPIVEVPLAAAPQQGIILFCEQQTSIADYLAAAPDRKAAERIFLLDVSRQDLPGVLERHGLVGAIEITRFISWRNDPENDFGGQVYGRRDVAERMRAVIAPPPWSGETYCLFDVPGTRDLPGALAAYLRAYWSAVLGGH
jgi:hypothetical protein